VHLDCHPWGVHLSDNTEDVGLDGLNASRDLHRFAYKIFAFSCAESTSKIAPLSNATFVPFDSYMKHRELPRSICNSWAHSFGHVFGPQMRRPQEASLLHAVFNLDSPLFNFREEQVRGDISLLQYSSALWDRSRG
jgi:hypothetical protein